jgi:hypothetical protein
VTEELDQTQQQLADIPDLAATLPQFLVGVTPKTDDGGGARQPARSRPPVDLALLDLIDGRELANWVTLAYETMTDLHYDMPGPRGWNEGFQMAAACEWLIKHTAWIDEQFPDPAQLEPLATKDPAWPLYCPDGHYLTTKRIRTRGGRRVCGMCPKGFRAAIEALHWAYRRAARELPGPRILCIKCGNEAYISNGWLVCREVREHQRTVKSIEMEYRRRLPMPSDDLAEEFHLEPGQLREWTRSHKLRPAGEHKTGGRGRPRKTFWPWDVFLLCNPAIAEALTRRDTVPA